MATERSHSVPASGHAAIVNPWWSERLQAEALLRHKRPEDLPVPQDEDLDLEAVQDQNTASGLGKGRGALTLGGRLFVTPPSRRCSEGRGRGGLGKTEGQMPGESSGEPPSRRDKTMGPIPPQYAPPPKHAPPPKPDVDDSCGLQRAMEAEMVIFLREENEKLQEEVSRLRQQQAANRSGPVSTPSSWETVDGGVGTGVRESGLHDGGPHVHVRGAAPQGNGLYSDGDPMVSTPRGRSPTTRRLQVSQQMRFTPNGTQIPNGPPPLDLDAPPMPPFPTSVSAEISGDSAEIQMQHYELFDAKRRGDSQWVPLCMREGKSYAPITAEDKTERLEREVSELKAALTQMRGNSAGSSEAVPPPSVTCASQPQSFGWAPTRGSGVGLGRDGVSPNDGWASVQKERSSSVGPREGGDMPYGRWHQAGGQPAMPLPWSEGTGNSKAELVELASDASPIELGDWLAVCGPVMRDLSSVSARWWNLTLREAQCFYDRWKTSSPLERVQIVARLPDELLDGCYQRTEQRGVNLLLRAIPADQQQALITARELNSTALLFRLLIRYQPGGAGEKAILLSKLTTLDKITGASDLAAALRSWRRHYARAQEVDAVLPDGTLLLKALEPACVLVASLDAQASFRLAQSRLQLAVDQQPIHQSVWRFSQCLLAEAETLSLLRTPSGGQPSPVKVKQLDAPQKTTSVSFTGDKGKGGPAGSTTSSTPCRYFRSDAGCKAGKSCKWSHSWEGIEDKHTRCWICGGKDHRRTECKLKAQIKSSPIKASKGAGEPGPGSGGGKSQSSSNGTSNAGLQSSGTTSQGAATAKLQEMEVQQDGNSATGPGDGQSGEATMVKGGADTGATTSEALLHEATQLLKSLRAPQLRVIKVSQLDYDTSGSAVLLDSGATHALRPAVDLCEWEAAQPTQVTLAEGVSNKLRLKQDSKVLLSAPHDTELDKSWIVPLGGIAELGYRFEWKGSYCLLKDDRGNKLEVTIQHGCPMVNKELGRQMIDRLERRQVHLAQKALLIKTLFAQPSMVPMAPPLSTEMALTLKLKHLFQDVPDDLLMKVIPDLSDLQQVADGSLLPWNRRKRRRLAQAKQIVIHLFSGPDARYWEKALQQNGVEVLCVDLQAAVAADLHDDNVYRFLLALAATGRVKAIVGGPPCRTVSALRYQDDDGPGILRSEEHPYGLPSISLAEQALVWGDSILLFRMLALYVLCEDVRHDHEPQTALALEQPEDPARYRPRAEVEKKKFMSIWRTKAWQIFANTYQIRMLHFDQGPMGHVRKKPTTLAVKLRDIQALDEIRGPPCGGEESDQDRRGMPLQDRCDQSKQWAAWAPGLKVALVLALQDHLKRGCAPSLEAALRPLGQVALESWRQHYIQDHMPARRDCKECVKAAARSKPHRRITHPEAYTLSVDLSGRMVIGQDQSRHDCKYMMVAVYTFPVDGAGKSLVEKVEAGADAGMPSLDLDEYTPTEPGVMIPVRIFFRRRWTRSRGRTELKHHHRQWRRLRFGPVTRLLMLGKRRWLPSKMWLSEI